MPQTSRGVPYPAPTSPNNVPADVQALAEWLNANPGVAPMTTTARDALSGVSLWDGRVIWNTSLDRLERYSVDAGAWEVVTPQAATQAEAEAGAAIATRIWSPLRIAQAIAKLARQVETYVFNVPGNVATQTGRSRIYLEAGFTVETIRAAVGTAPAGAALVVDVNKNGTTLFTAQGNRPQITPGNNTATGSPEVIDLAAGDYLTVDVDQVGSGTTGADLTVTVRLRKVI